MDDLGFGLSLPQAAEAEIRGLLCNVGEELSPTVKAHILGFAHHGLERLVFDTLVSILGDTNLVVDSGVKGWAPIHAAALLGELGDVAAVDPLVKVIREFHFTELIVEEAMEALTELAPRALDRILQLYEEEPHFAIARVLAHAQVRDERILQLLVAGLEGPDRVHSVLDLSTYGDPAALPALGQALDRYEVSARPPELLVHQEAIELIAAIEELGGELSPAQELKRRKIDQDRQEKRRQLLKLFETRDEVDLGPQGWVPPGRNELCWCDSGQKYKKCHLRFDEEARRP